MTSVNTTPSRPCMTLHSRFLAPIVSLRQQPSIYSASDWKHILLFRHQSSPGDFSARGLGAITSDDSSGRTRKKLRFTPNKFTKPSFNGMAPCRPSLSSGRSARQRWSTRVTCSSSDPKKKLRPPLRVLPSQLMQGKNCFSSSDNDNGDALFGFA